MFVDEARLDSSVASGTAVLDGDRLEQFTLDEVELQLCQLGAKINAATARWLTLAGEFDRRGGHEAFGFVSCATWLAWRCSITPRAAREQLRVARRLRELPLIAGAFGRGRLSYSKVRALTRAAEPAMEGDLLELAEEATAAQLERIMRGYRAALEPDAAANAQSRRHLTTWWEDDGSLTIRASLPPEEGALFLKGLEVAGQELRDGPREEDATEAERGDEGAPARRDRADGLVALAESAIARGAAAASGGDRHQVVVHIDLDALGSRSETASAALSDGAALPAETVRRLGCDASIVSLVEQDGEPLSVGRKTRSIPPALARALRSRDQGCRFPGCDRDRFVDAHHIEHWARGGETSLNNLIQLCRHHHRLVHEGGYSVARDGGDLVFRTPQGRVLQPVPGSPEGSTRACLATTGDGGGCGSSEVEPSRPGGEPMDLDLAVFVLADLQERRSNSAGDAGPLVLT